ncbi:MAG: hypothetical protein WC364_09245 [Eubacteriales bacterium]
MDSQQHLSTEQQAVLDCIPASRKEAISRRYLVVYNPMTYELGMYVA